MAERRVEVFSAGCTLCREVIEKVKELTCENCELKIHDLNSDDEGEARKKLENYGISRVPAVVVDGEPVDCCGNLGSVSKKALLKAGLGQN